MVSPGAARLAHPRRRIPARRRAALGAMALRSRGAALVPTGTYSCPRLCAPFFWWDGDVGAEMRGEEMAWLAHLRPAQVSKGRRCAKVRMQNAALPVKTSGLRCSATFSSPSSDRVSRLCTAHVNKKVVMAISQFFAFFQAHCAPLILLTRRHLSCGARASLRRGAMHKHAKESA